MANGASFDYPMRGPFGMCLQKQLNETFNQNVAFSESAWENAKQNCQYGCVLPPGIPQWPPGVTPLSSPAQFATSNRPGMSDAQIINSLQAKPFQFDSPFVVKNEYVSPASPMMRQSVGNACPMNNVQQQTQASQMTQLASALTSAQTNGNLITTFARSLVEAVKGMSYDAKNWSQLPGNTTGEKLKFMLTHDPDRGLVIGLGVMILLAIILFVVFMCVIACCRGCT